MAKTVDINKYIKHLFRKYPLDIIEAKSPVININNEEVDKDNSFCPYTIKIISANYIQDIYKVNDDVVSDRTLWTSKRIVDEIKKQLKNNVSYDGEYVILNNTIKIKSIDNSKVEVIANPANNEVLIIPKFQRFEYISNKEKDVFLIFHGLNTFNLNIDVLVYNPQEGWQEKEIFYVSFPTENLVYLELAEPRKVRLFISKI